MSNRENNSKSKIESALTHISMKHSNVAFDLQRNRATIKFISNSFHSINSDSWDIYLSLASENNKESRDRPTVS